MESIVKRDWALVFSILFSVEVPPSGVGNLWRRQMILKNDVEVGRGRRLRAMSSERAKVVVTGPESFLELNLDMQ